MQNAFLPLKGFLGSQVEVLQLCSHPRALIGLIFLSPVLGFVVGATAGRFQVRSLM
jgi:uncharacterized membrane protein YoaK (UPF0700 family)